MTQTSQSKLTLLYTYCKKGDLISLAQLLQSDSKLLDNKRNLMYKSLEYKQHHVLKYLLTNHKPNNYESYNLLHIALR